MYPFTLSLSKPYGQTPRRLTLHTCSPRHTTYMYQIQPWIPTQSKVTLILSNSAYYPLPGLKHTPKSLALWLHLAYILAYKCMKHHLKLLKITIAMWYKVVGYYLYIHIADGLQFRWDCHLDIWGQSPASICTARTVIHIENQPTYPKIKIKCYKSDVYRLPSHMVHVLDHVHTCIHSIQYLLQFPHTFLINYT